MASKAAVRQMYAELYRQFAPDVRMRFDTCHQAAYESATANGLTRDRALAVAAEAMAEEMSRAIGAPRLLTISVAEIELGNRQKRAEAAVLKAPKHKKTKA
jgi:hypothetical protein